MIIANGTIESITKTGGGINASTGFPAAPSEAYGTAVPCQWRHLSFDRLARSSQSDSPITKATYEILIEGTAAPGSEDIRLKDSDGTVMGVLSVRHCEILKAVGQVRLYV